MAKGKQVRAIFYNDQKLESIERDSLISITDENLHHLSNVVRIKKGESLLLLDGQGRKVSSTVDTITKKNIQIKVNSNEFSEPPALKIKLAFSIPKREAQEDIFRLATELGVHEIIPFVSEFSQRSLIKEERIDKILKSALIQSNNTYLPKVSKLHTYQEFLGHLGAAAQYIYFSSQRPCKEMIQAVVDDPLMIIGPEGGFSSDEEELILKSGKVSLVHLSTPIMRAPTALAAAVGFIHCKRQG